MYISTIKPIPHYPTRIPIHLIMWNVNSISTMTKPKYFSIIGSSINLNMIYKFRNKSGMPSLNWIGPTRREYPESIPTLTPMATSSQKIVFPTSDSREEIFSNSLFGFSRTRIDSLPILLGTRSPNSSTSSSGRRRDFTDQLLTTITMEKDINTMLPSNPKKNINLSQID